MERPPPKPSPFNNGGGGNSDTDNSSRPPLCDSSTPHVNDVWLHYCTYCILRIYVEITLHSNARKSALCFSRVSVSPSCNEDNFCAVGFDPWITPKDKFQDIPSRFPPPLTGFRQRHTTHTKSVIGWREEYKLLLLIPFSLLLLIDWISAHVGIKDWREGEGSSASSLRRRK